MLYYIFPKWYNKLLTKANDECHSFQLPNVRGENIIYIYTYIHIYKYTYISFSVYIYIYLIGSATETSINQSNSSFSTWGHEMKIKTGSAR